MEENSNKLKSLISKGSEIAGSVSSAAIGLVLAGPAGAIVGAAIGPMITSAFEKVGLEISNTFLGNREQARIGMAYGNALVEIKRRIDEGNIPRNDNFYESSNSERSSAETILEGVLLKAKGEYEEKKIKFYSFFLANLTFDESIDFNKANMLLRLVEQLSYRQIVILAFFFKHKKLNINRWDIAFLQDAELQVYHDFYTELIDLYNKMLTQQTGNGGISMGIIDLTISPIGSIVSQLMNLDSMPTEDVQNIEIEIAVIDQIVKRYK